MNTKICKHEKAINHNNDNISSNLFSATQNHKMKKTKTLTHTSEYS